MLYTHITEFAFKRHVMTSDMGATFVAFILNPDAMLGWAKYQEWSEKLPQLDKWF